MTTDEPLEPTGAQSLVSGLPLPPSIACPSLGRSPKASSGRGILQGLPGSGPQGGRGTGGARRNTDVRAEACQRRQGVGFLKFRAIADAHAAQEYDASPQRSWRAESETRTEHECTPAGVRRGRRYLDPCKPLTYMKKPFWSHSPGGASEYPKMRQTSSIMSLTTGITMLRLSLSNGCTSDRATSLSIGS